MKDIVTPVPPEEVRNVIKLCLENAALVNYTRISDYAKIEGTTTSFNSTVYTENILNRQFNSLIVNEKSLVHWFDLLVYRHVVLTVI